MNANQKQEQRFSMAFGFALFHFLVNPILLFVGFCALGAGHGNPQLWYLALGSCLLFNLTLFNVVVTSYRLRKADIERAFIFYLFLFLFLVYSGISLWVVLNGG